MEFPLPTHTFCDFGSSFRVGRRFASVKMLKQKLFLSSIAFWTDWTKQHCFYSTSLAYTCNFHCKGWIFTLMGELRDFYTGQILKFFYDYTCQHLDETNYTFSLYLFPKNNILK
jgi:hypothetical protein